MVLGSVKYPYLDCEGIVEGIRRDDPGEVERLYNYLRRGLRSYMFRKRAPDGEDLAQNAFLAAVAAIQKGELRDPNRLVSFVLGVARNIAAAAIADMVKSRDRNRTIMEQSVIGGHLVSRHQNQAFDQQYSVATPLPNAEHSLLNRERTQMMARALSKLRPKEREILDRFYLQEQICQRICAEMNLSETQYRLLKSRAKAHLAILVRRYSGRAEVAADFRLAHRNATSAGCEMPRLRRHCSTSQSAGGSDETP